MNVIVIGPTLLTKACIGEIAKQHNILALFTLDEISGSKKSRYTTFFDQAERYNFKIYQVKKVNTPETISLIKSLNPDLIIEAGWSEIIPKEILEIPRKGTIGIHGAILPNIKGGASMNWALIQGEKEWGVTLYYLVEKVDEGDIIATKKFKITLEDDIETLHCKSDLASEELLEENLHLIEQNKEPRIRQDPSQGIKLPQRKPEDSRINWNKNTLEIYNWIRAQTHPFPGAFTFFKDKKLYIWKAHHEEYPEREFKPGQITEIDEHGIKVKTPNNSILLKRLNFENEPEQLAYDFALRNKLKIGDSFV